MPALSEGTFPLSSRSPRVGKILPITLWDTSNANGRKWPGAILDLSDHGLRIATGTALREGQVVSVVVNDIGLCFKRCRVVWTRTVQAPRLDQAGLEVLK
ncbi:MAG: PilZ domain-containing protein [Acidobacteriota bacterium]